VPSIRQELDATRTARWYQAARSAHRAGAWEERARCFTALSAILAEHRIPWRPYQGRSQPPIRPRGILAEVARHAHFASAESVYKRWRARQDGQPIARWAGPDPAVKPGAAFVAEAKIVAFWPYREGALEVADAFDMTLAEVAAAYLRALAAWACDDIPLAACHPAGPPACVAEDMEVIAAQLAWRADPETPRARAAWLTELAHGIVSQVFADGSITPLGAFNTVRDELLQLLAEPDSVADRVACSVAELSDRLMHAGDGEAVLDADQARQMLGALEGLSQLLADVALADATTNADPGTGPGRWFR
jgi:hypothetical protein